MRRPKTGPSRVVIVVFSLLVLISMVLSLAAQSFSGGGRTPTATPTQAAQGALSVL